MPGFIGRWMSEAVSLSLPLAAAILAIQLPALTGDYTAALLQVTNDARRDIDQREQSARDYYHITASSDDGIVQALKSTEPSNAQTLEQSLDRVHVLSAAHDRIMATTPLLQPPTALLDALADEHGYKMAVLRTALETHVIQIAFSSAAAIYGVCGLVLGSLIAQFIISMVTTIAGPARERYPERML